jgi:hypothetical protein
MRIVAWTGWLATSLSQGSSSNEGHHRLQEILRSIVERLEMSVS